MNKKRKLKVVFGSSLALLAAASVASCGGKGSSEYKVSFNVKDPDTTDTITLDDIAPVTVKKGGTVDLTKYSLTYSGYTFGGWFTDEACTTEFTSATKVTKNLKLYAKWTKAVAKFKVTYVSEQGTAPAALNDVNALPAELPTLTADGYTFEGWFTDAECTKAAVAGAAISANTTLYAKWTAASESSIDIPEGYEEVKAYMDIATVVEALGAGKKFGDASYTSGQFTIDKDSNLETRSRGKKWTKASYDKYEGIDLYKMLDGSTEKSFTHSIKLMTNAGITFTALGNGNCRAYIQNGSTDEVKGNNLHLIVKKDGQDYKSIAYPCQVDGSPLVQVCFDIEEGHTYQVMRDGSGTVDLYGIELDMAVVKSEVSSISVVVPGKNKFIAGMDFVSTGLTVAAVKANGATQALDNADLTIDSSAVDFTTAGTYNVKVKYGTFETEYPVTVYDLTEIDLGLNKTVLEKTNTAAGNQRYVNHTVQQVYSVGDELDGDALTVFAIANNDYFERFDVESKFVSVTAPDGTAVDMSTAGAKNLKITLTMNGVTKSETVQVFVVDTPIAKVTEGTTVKEVNVYVNPNYQGEIGAVNTLSAVSKECNTFVNIQQALDFLQLQTDLATVRKNIYLAQGLYAEKLEISLPYVSIIGVAGAENTIIQWNSLYGVEDESGFTQVTDSTQTVAVRDTALNCIIDGVTISNYYNDIQNYADDDKGFKSGERALALLVQGDQFIMQNSRLLGWQDTLELFTGRQYFKNTYISGCVDYIFGTNNTTLFEECEIHTIKSKTSYTDDSKVTAYLTAFKGMNKGSADAIKYGAIFNNCNFTVEDGFVGKIAVGRCWGDYSAVAILNSKLCDKISTSCKETIVSMNANNTSKNIQYWFYNNTAADGTTPITFTEDIEGGITNHVLTASEAAKYIDKSVVFGDTNGGVTWNNAWDPSYTGVVVDNNIYYDFGAMPSTTGTVYTWEHTATGAVNDTIGGLTINTSKCQTGQGAYTEVQPGTMTLNVEANTLISIKTGYNTNDNLNINGIGTSADTLQVFFATAQTVTITYTAKTYVLGIKVTPNATEPEHTLSKLLVKGLTKEYNVGEEFDSSKLVVKAEYTDKQTIVLASSDYSVDLSAVDFTKAGTYNAKIVYGTVEYEFEIVVSADSAAYIEGLYTVSFKDDATNAAANYIVYDDSVVNGSLQVGKITLVDNGQGVVANNNDWLKFNTGAKAQFLLASAATLSITFHQDANNVKVYVNGTEVTKNTDGTYTLSAGKVSIEAQSSGYIGKIIVNAPQVITGQYTVSFKDDATNAAANYIVYDDSAISGSLQVGKITLVDNGQGVVANNNDWLKFNTGAKAEFTVATAATLSITFHQDANNVKVYVNGTEVTKNTDGTYTLPAGKVSIEAQSSGYIGKIIINSGVVIDTNYTVSFKDDATNAAANYIVYDDSVINGSLQVGKITLVDNGQGVVANNNDWLKFNTGAKAEFNTIAPTTLTITFHQDANNVKVYVNGTEVTKNTDGTYTLPAGKVVIEAQSSGYIGKIIVQY